MGKNDKKSTLYSEVPGISIQECPFILDIICGDITFPFLKKIEVYLTYGTILVRVCNVIIGHLYIGITSFIALLR